MPVYETAVDLRCPPREAFEFLARPANLLAVTPPELHAKLIDAPERLALGARITVRLRRLGIAQTIVTEVTAFEEGAFFTDEQVQGPLGKLVHTHRVEPTPAGCRIVDRFEYEPPGGLLGLVVTAAMVEAELKKSFAYREKKFRELLDRPED